MQLKTSAILLDVIAQQSTPKIDIPHAPTADA